MLIEAKSPSQFSMMHKAAAGALLLHLLLLALIPDIPQWKLPFAEQGFRLNVLLQIDDEEEFDQSLNYPSNEAVNTSSEASALNIASSAPGHEDTEAKQSDEVTGANADPVESRAVGQSTDNRISPRVLFSHASIMQFARQEAVRYADYQPRELARFNRSFNSRRQYQRRKRTNSYKNQYGDQYVNNGASNGDICFVKTADKVAKPSGTFDSGTYTVHFFRCKDKERGLLEG